VARATSTPRASSAARITHARLTAATSVDPSWSLPLAMVTQYESTTTTTTTTTTMPRPAVVPVVNHVVPTTTATLPPPAPAPAPAASATGHEETGAASWYAHPAGYCASPDLPFGTVVTVTDLSSGASVTCTIDDREASNPGRVIDMSEQTFTQLADPSVGLIQVSVRW